MVWSWLWCVIWSWFWVIWSWFWMIWFIVGYSFVRNFGNVSMFMISSVGYNLSSTIRKENSVLSGNCTIFILNFVLSKVCTRILVLYAIFICKRLWWDLLWMVWCRFVCWRRGVLGLERMLELGL